MDSDRIWQQTLSNLQHSLTRATFEAHIQQTKLKTVQGKNWTLETPSEASLAWLENRLKDVIATTLANAAGLEEIELTFVARVPVLYDESKLPEDFAATEIVLALGQMHFEGNIIPASWFQHLRYDSGKPHTNALLVLSDIAYWYRPTVVRDERTGQVTGYRKKFRADKLQRSYAYFTNLFGFSKQQVKDAINYLIRKGLVTKELRTLKTKDGALLNNVMFLEPVPERLMEITYSLKEADPYGLEV